MNNTQKLIFEADCKVFGIPLPTPEYQFAKPRRFRFDFAWTDIKLALEVEGGVYGHGKKCPLCKQQKRIGHLSVSRFKSDIEKYNLAALNGWVVIRVLPENLHKQEFLTLVKQVYQNNEATKSEANT